MHHRSRIHRLLAIALAAGAASATAAAQGSFVDFANGDIGDLLGASVASVGDVDGDGTPDVAVGSPGYDSPLAGQNVGCVWIYSGRTGETILHHEGTGADGELGFSVAAAGDVDLDGVPDVIAGEPGKTQIVGVALHGGCLVISGADSTVLMSMAQILGGDARSGHAVAGIGDVDQDGRADVAVGAPLIDNSAGVDAGWVYVYSSQQLGPNPTLIGSLPGSVAGERAGFSIAGLGDVDGDGTGDLAIGGPGYSSGIFLDQGRVRVKRLDNTEIYSLFGVAQLAGEFGYSVAAAGDLTGDGIQDLLIGTPGYDSGGLNDRGRAQTHDGATGAPLSIYVGTLGGDRAGESVAGPGDVDMDGVPDLLVGAPSSNVSTPFGVLDAGVTRLYSGQTDALLDEYSTFSPYTHSGSAVAGAGDLDLDGRADILIGAPSFVGLNGKAGSASIHFGGPVNASWNTYGAGLAGTFGTPSILLASDPEMCTSNTLTLVNSAPSIAPTTLFLGFSKADLPTGLGASVLVAPPWITLSLALPPGPSPLPVATPCDALLNGTRVYLQILVSDPGAQKGVAFSPGVEVIHGT